MDKVKQLSPSVLAFVGDGVYGLFVRTKLSEVNRPSGELHKMSVQYVNASSQAKAYEIIADALTENEMGIFKRGRNFQTHSAPKSSTLGEYHTATGL
ncbi:MAG: ribonuclease III, partial [Clostridia bacterium]|nr:ribonuclease III [Clostridia bacterium]